MKKDKKINSIYKDILIDLRLIVGLNALKLALWVWPDGYNKDRLAVAILNIALNLDTKNDS